MANKKNPLLYEALDISEERYKELGKTTQEALDSVDDVFSVADLLSAAVGKLKEIEPTEMELALTMYQLGSFMATSRTELEKV